MKVIADHPLSAKPGTVGIVEWLERQDLDIDFLATLKDSSDVEDQARDDHTFDGVLFRGGDGKCYTVLPFVVEADYGLVECAMGRLEHEEEDQTTQIAEAEARLAQLRAEAARRQARLARLKSVYDTPRN